MLGEGEEEEQIVMMGKKCHLGIGGEANNIVLTKPQVLTIWGQNSKITSPARLSSYTHILLALTPDDV